MTDYKAMSYGEIASLLKGYGSPIGTFNQTTFRTDMGQRVAGRMVSTLASFGGNSLGGGYCAGVCFDWARRVLLTTPGPKEPLLSYGYGDMADGKGTRANRDLVESKHRAYATVGRMAGAWDANNNLNWTRPGGSQGPLQLQDGAWSRAAATLDASFDQSRGEDARKLSSKRFSSLNLIASSNATYASPGSWMGELLSNGLRLGNVSKVGFNGQSGEGHAIAIWQRKDSVRDADAYYFFDPNYGVFAYSQQGLKLALQILFWKDADDTPRYDECTSQTQQKMSYVIFGSPAQTAVARPVSRRASLEVERPVASASPARSDPPPVEPSRPAVNNPTNAYGPGAPNLPAPGNIARPVTTQPALAGTLKGKLAHVRANGKKLAKRGGVATADGLGYVQLDQELCKEIIRRKLFENNAGLRGESPMGEWIQLGFLDKIIAAME